ncbi:MAG: hypothetical protein BGO07_02865 [Alphaproteobacteria bacterium 40-19]|nr:MAG: hypothetical protein BGO07_02865 [Alphaproteobacteria bacterium 40-19]
MVEFLFKCPNLEKSVLGKEPDSGEREALLCLKRIAKDIQKIYPPGTCIQILLMGIPITRFVGIPFSETKAYEKALRKISSDLT